MVMADDSASLDRVVRDIEQLHEFFVAWFAADAARDRDLFEAAVGGRLAPGFTIVTPAGRLLERAQILAGIEADHGSNPGFRIEIRQPRLLHRQGALILVTYEEWQQGARNVTPANNGRLSTALLAECDGPPNGLSWLHVHETWLP